MEARSGCGAGGCPRSGATPGASRATATCNTHEGQSPPAYPRLPVLLQDSAAAPSTEPGKPDPGTGSQRWDGFAGLWEGSGAAEACRRA